MNSRILTIAAFVLTLAFGLLPHTADARFLSTDPIGYQDQLNLYAYCASDPVNCVDPNGEQMVPWEVTLQPAGLSPAETAAFQEAYGKGALAGGAITASIALSFVDGPLPVGDALGASLAAKGAPKLGKLSQELLNSTSELAISAATDGVTDSLSKPAGDGVFADDILNRDPLAGTQTGTLQNEPLSMDPNSGQQTPNKSPKSLGGKILEGVRAVIKVIDDAVE